MPDALLLSAAVLAAVAGMGWLALGMDLYWRQVHGGAPRRHATVRRLRVLGTLGLLTSLALCLSVDHASMASLVWVMMLTTATITIAFTLTWRAHWLRLLTPRRQRAAQE
jgi:hypothetical protein